MKRQIPRSPSIWLYFTLKGIIFYLSRQCFPMWCSSKTFLPHARTVNFYCTSLIMEWWENMLRWIQLDHSLKLLPLSASLLSTWHSTLPCTTLEGWQHLAYQHQKNNSNLRMILQITLSIAIYSYHNTTWRTITTSEIVCTKSARNQI